MYPDLRALDELERLNKISLNKNKSDWDKQNKNTLKISSLNCRSLNKHFNDISTDEVLLQSDIIALQETWLEDDDINDNLNIPGYDLHLNSNGRGKGLATYYKSSIFKHHSDKKNENIQLSKFTSHHLDIITLYRSQHCNLKIMNKLLEEIIEKGKPQLLLGDFNYCYLDSYSNSTCKFLHQSNFEQIIHEPTHLEGNLLDQAYLRDINGNFKCTVKLHSKYYTDHKGIALLIEKGSYNTT